MKTIQCNTTSQIHPNVFADRNGYLPYDKLKCLNTEIRKLSDKLKDAYGINVGTDHTQCDEPLNP